MERSKLILIGGTSHVGKSTFGRRLAEELGWNYLSTDQLARHPGRPWKDDSQLVPADVVEHYTNLSVTALMDSVLSHYRRNVWPIIDAILHSRLSNPFDLGLVFEGSAFLPDLVRIAPKARVRSIWLTVPHLMIMNRIKDSSDYEKRSIAERRLIDAFIRRSIAFDQHLKDSVDHSQIMLDASSANPFETLRLLA